MNVKDNISHYARVEKYAKAVQDLFFDVANKSASLVEGLPIPEGEMFKFVNHPELKYQVDALFTEMAQNMNLVIQTGIRDEWFEALSPSDRLIQKLSERVQILPELLEKYQSRGLEALEAFQTRKIKGMNLSDRVWKYTNQYKGDIEMALDIGLGDRKSASQLSRDIRKYLQKPDDLFRRVRNKHGNLVLSKNAKAYHTGRGVYRSAYKNAMRLTRTEVNMAYRTSDYERRKNLDFVVGIEIRRSNRVFGCPICEELKGKYPKDFKFMGWHPHCRCHTVSILSSDEEFIEQQKAIIEGRNVRISSKNEVKQTPDGFNQWVKDNIERANQSSSKPHWMIQNRGFVNKAEKITDKPIRRITSAEGKLAVQKTWNKRRNNRRFGEELRKLHNSPEYGSAVIKKLTSNIEVLIRSGERPDTIAPMMSSLRRKVKVKANWDARKEIIKMSDVLDNPIQAVAIHGKESVQTAYISIKEKLNEISGYDLATQKKKLEFEIDWVGKSKKYSTWEVAENAYKKKLSEVTYTIKKADIEDMISGAMTYSKTTKSPVVKKLAGEMEEMLQNNVELSKLEAKAKELDKNFKRLENERLARLRKSGKISGGLQELSEKEIDDLLDNFENKISQLGQDGIIRKDTEAVWNSLNVEEKNIVTKYTQTFSYLNERLRGISYMGDRSASEFLSDMPLLTKTLNKVETQRHMVVRRGVDNFYSSEVGKSLSDFNVGDIFTEKGFLSSAIHPEAGMTKDINMVIVVPKGAKGIYAEPFSHYTDYGKFKFSDNPKNATLWDGVTKEAIREEMEWIGNRGSRLKVLKKKGNTIYFQLLEQVQD